MMFIKFLNNNEAEQINFILQDKDDFTVPDIKMLLYVYYCTVY
jgi:hypothetical protein